MALSGSFTFERLTEHETETETIEVYYPLDMPEDDPLYALRGTTGSQEVAAIVSSSVTYPSAYINIANISSFSDYYINEDNNLDKNTIVEASLKLWENHNEYLAKSSSILDGRDLTYNFTYNFTTDSASFHEFVYNTLKENYTEFANLTDV